MEKGVRRAFKHYQQLSEQLGKFQGDYAKARTLRRKVRAAKKAFEREKRKKI
jgi:hypothetical protein